MTSSPPADGTGRLVSVNVVHQIRPDPGGPVGRTGIDKRPSDEPVRLHRLGPVGDAVLDRKDHGGPDQAVYAYAMSDLAQWSVKLGRDLEPGVFGENLTLDGVDVTGAVIGERWEVDAVGDQPPVLLEVTAPRIPCRTFATWMDEPHWVRRFTEHGAPGAYLRVLGEGVVAAGARVRVISRPAHGVSISEVFVLRHADPDRLRSLLSAGTNLHRPLAAAVADQLRRTG